MNTPICLLISCTKTFSYAAAQRGAVSRTFRCVILVFPRGGDVLSRLCIGSLVSWKLGIEPAYTFFERLKGRIWGGQAWDERGGKNKINGGPLDAQL